jgi:hypothetical protein
MGVPRLVLIITLISTECLFAVADEKPNRILVYQHLLDSIGNLPWNVAAGYSLQGQFQFKATGEEINYQARFIRQSNGWAADFSNENKSRNMRFVRDGKNSWVASPEITADVSPELFPYAAQFDFPLLYGELLRILKKGDRDPLYAMQAVGNEIYVRGSLRNGWKATFVLNKTEYFPRKVLIGAIGEPSAAWLLPLTRPDGSCIFIRTPEPISKFEIWFSDPVMENGYSYARRMDFVDDGNVTGTFILEQGAASNEKNDLFERPARLPWSEAAIFDSEASLRNRSIFIQKSEIAALQSRIGEEPWSEWNRKSRWIAAWALLAVKTGPLFPKSASFRFIRLTVLICFLAFILLLFRRKRQTGNPLSLKLLIAGAIVSLFVIIAGAASTQFHQSTDHSLFALHCAIRYAATGDSSYAERTEALLSGFASQAPAKTIETLGQSSQAYALAYDLIRTALSEGRRGEIEQELFEYAKPLFGAANGWAANMDDSSVIAAGLGMTGLVTGNEPYIKEACAIIERTLDSQFVDGLHRSGPGQGGVSLNSAVNLFYGLKRTNRTDYYSHPSFQKYLTAAFKLISPVGTLPLFGNTRSDDSATLSLFFLKIANHVPVEDGRRCVAAGNLYWDYGRYGTEGWKKWITPFVRSMLAYYENPYVMLHYSKVLNPSRLPSSSVVLGDGQLAVLRSGSSTDSIYLALNMSRSNINFSSRDILTFDLYANRSLMLHGPGSPEMSSSTAAGNSITFNGESQSGARCSGIESSLINQPLFDYLRALADKTYDYGQVQRDIVLVRPEKNQPGYLFMLDDILTNDPGTSVEWHLHGRGNVKAGVNHEVRWTAAVSTPPRLRTPHASLDVSHPIGDPGQSQTRSGTLSSQTPFLNQISSSAITEWIGSKRFCTFLQPGDTGTAKNKISAQGKYSCRIGNEDWISMGNLETRVTTGPLSHISEYVIVRDRMKSFPALLMVGGLECRFGLHSLHSTKPITVSMSGLYGEFHNSHPDTMIEIFSPDIHAGDRFHLDQQLLISNTAGILIFTIDEAGKHRFRKE